MGEKTILIVDDHGALRYILSFDLQKKGFKTITAGSGEKGIEVAQKDSPDLILLDAMMPGIDGYQTCERLKADDRTRDIPVMFISALNDSFDKVKAFTAGGVDYIGKRAIKCDAEFLSPHNLSYFLGYLYIRFQEDRSRFGAVPTYGILRPGKNPFAVGIQQ